MLKVLRPQDFVYVCVQNHATCKYVFSVLYELQFPSFLFS